MGCEVLKCLHCIVQQCLMGLTGVYLFSCTPRKIVQQCLMGLIGGPFSCTPRSTNNVWPYIYLVTRCSRQKPDDILAIIGWILVSQISDVDLVQDWGFNCSGAVSRTCDGQLSYRAFSTIRYTVLHPCACVCVPLACIACRVYY